jgi:hypothetical protein
MRDEEILKDILFGLFLVTALSLTVVYIMVPERAEFIENQMEWWNDFLHMVRSFT